MAKIKMRGKIKAGVASIKALIPHPMETGTRRDADDNLIAAHYIKTVTCKLNGEVVMEADWGASVSKDPYFAFMIRDAVPGDKVTISWLDNLDESSSNELVLK